ncbi:hypothetical protein [Acaryochloris thomasi]|uniref:hypothetical protein n=1 Tax=Acaryochloris thomasi TaxID=2929456 RepID=UPI000DA6C654|nr:hypothetical protein [Acaryochloris thomasi]
MKTKFSLALAISAMTFSAASGPILMAEKVQAQPQLDQAEQSSSESQDVIKRVVEPQRCITIAGIGRFCW